jgi:hypothetical protein
MTAMGIRGWISTGSLEDFIKHTLALFQEKGIDLPLSIYHWNVNPGCFQNILIIFGFSISSMVHEEGTDGRAKRQKEIIW